MPEPFIGQITVHAKIAADPPNGVTQAEAWESLNAAIQRAVHAWHEARPGVLVSEPEVF
jgi:hypothetical protein